MANETARKLRRTMTPQEVKLWLHLRELRKLGFHFRRQVPIEDFIVDFACFNPRIVVELDGSQHARPQYQSRDSVRDVRLAAEGFRIVRVWNNDVDTNIEGVFEKILHELRQR